MKQGSCVNAVLMAGLILLFAIPFVWPSSVAAKKLKVAVSILPQKYFVGKIGKDRVHVSVMVMPGASPATYEPKPRQMIDLSKADLYFAIGVPFEAGWLTKFQKINPKMRVVPTQTGVERVPMESRSHAESHADNQAESLDPHIWLSPPLVLQQAKTIRNALMKADPAGKEIYRKNYAAFETEILILDEKIRRLLGQKKSGKAFMVYHPSWGYFARTYGLKQVPVELEGKEPSPRELVELIQKARKEHIKVIFVQPQFSQKSAQAIARAVGAKILVADSLSEDWENNLMAVARKITQSAK